MNERKTLYFTLLKAEQFDDGFMPNPNYEGASVRDLLGWIDALVGRVPEKHQDSIRFRFDSIGGYEGEHYPSVEVTWSRPETDEEMADRIRSNTEHLAAERARKEAEERATLERLKAKYEGQNA